MTHLPYLIPSYALAVLIPGWLAIGAAHRLRSARRRLALLDPRGERAP